MTASLDLAIVNATIPYAAHGAHRNIRLTEAGMDLLESGLDSMDVAVLGAYLCELFDVPLELQKDIPSIDVQTMFAFLRAHGRRMLHEAADVERMLGPST